MGLSCLCATVLSVLVACGGGAGNESRSSATEGQLDPETQHNASPAASAERTQRIFQEGAKLNAAELEQIAQTGVLPEPFDGPLLSGAVGSTAATLNADLATKSAGERKSAASRVPAYRFFNGSTGAHFYTTSTTERDNTINNLPAFSYEGPAFYVSSTTVPGLSPVHRFLNTQSGVHFYTISEAERANVAANLPQFTYEGIAYYASTLAGTGYTPLYRFFVSAQGFHFYTNSLAERDTIISTLPQYSYEGIGYYVLGSDWQTPAVPHTGIKNTQCYTVGSNTLVKCFTAEGLTLNNRQDGHRTQDNPMSYSAVAGHATSDCLRDDVTGLVWEVKQTGPVIRSVDQTFTNLGNGMDNDASGYVAAMNNLGLCGFNDWRLPSVEELQGIVDYSVSGGAASTISSIFSHTKIATYRTSSPAGPTADWGIYFVSGALQAFSKNSLTYLRLVRGAPWTGQRYIITSVDYTGDSANNAVIDRRTGLTWRRCVEGQIWSGSACSGSGFHYTHENALIAARMALPWRLPNIKELNSLSDYSQSDGVLDRLGFPYAPLAFVWSTTPVGWAVNTTNGYVDTQPRNAGQHARLVRSTP
ncbi:hypothetical protein LPB72_21125 [Hydrogenophaga crassostreae]|uniref:DUF1566 domain-containing protein n=2 Tax=Hydrogenophaga crassostreae TaxID=1763535 RepID=A0A167GIG3_9BURK|nr:hypothetical protein LPB072_21740 [Hydrogenophaga crassostreae]OAD39491.1 hypothetical protein LPB72_21125 [Hydrogenophaga crassostreae]